ncbi:hypothetical protein [uncultured Kordia sp.]|uniref:hypothetical protein n=1 Tax=uncultured Kordia sp. TaxID=507699 RepID=UPI00260C7E6C|nr:hypothetical protein [uncultured Kordia sp.]
MKKKKVGLVLKKVCVSKLRDIQGGNPRTSFDLPCVVTMICSKLDEDLCQTFLTATDSIEKC